MKKDGAIFLLATTLLFVGLLVGVLIGRQTVKDPFEIHDVIPSESTADTVAPTIYDPRIDINTASEEMLQLIPGIGPVLSKRIVEYRNANGPFQDIWQLSKVYGIGKNTIKEIQSLIKVEDTQ